MVQEKLRAKKGEVAPYLSLTEALEIAGEIQNKAGESIDSDGLVRILGNPTSSSSYFKKVAALKAWGIITKEEKYFKLTPDALSIVLPRSENERRESMLNCFLKVGKLKEIAKLYAGKTLPEDDFLISALKKDIGLNGANMQDWIKTFKEAGKLVGIFMDVKGRLHVRQTFDQIIKDQTTEQETGTSQLTSPQTIAATSVPALSGGDFCEIKTPSCYFRGPKTINDTNLSDIKAILSWFRAYYGKNLEEQAN